MGREIKLLAAVTASWADGGKSLQASKPTGLLHKFLTFPLTKNHTSTRTKTK